MTTTNPNPLDRISIERRWAMSNKHTFSIGPIGDLVRRVVADWRRTHPGLPVVDPFCGGRTDIADINNDLDPLVSAEYHEDALDFLRRFNDSSVAGVMFDPPYSQRQVAESYRRLGKSVNLETTQSSYWSKLKAEIGRIVRPGGGAVACSWNSGGIGKKYGFRITDVLLVPHGSWKHDTICVVEEKVGNDK